MKRARIRCRLSRRPIPTFRPCEYKQWESREVFTPVPRQTWTYRASNQNDFHDIFRGLCYSSLHSPRVPTNASSRREQREDRERRTAAAAAARLREPAAHRVAVHRPRQQLVTLLAVGTSGTAKAQREYAPHTEGTGVVQPEIVERRRHVQRRAQRALSSRVTRSSGDKLWRGIADVRFA